MEDIAVPELQTLDLVCEGKFQAALLPGPKLGRAGDEEVIYRQTDACSTSKCARSGSGTVLVMGAESTLATLVARTARNGLTIRSQ